jgi:hypothetical protein
MKRLGTIAEVIAELGGAKELLKLTKRGHSVAMVHNWTYRNQFPPQTYRVMQAALNERGLSAPSELWGMQ